ncbi:putative calmodulin-like protein 6 [Diplonema papillatum]|nr:putative calmodulin-like protein 6 [Diplonema papillatum]
MWRLPSAATLHPDENTEFQLSKRSSNLGGGGVLRQLDSSRSSLLKTTLPARPPGKVSIAAAALTPPTDPPIPPRKRAPKVRPLGGLPRRTVTIELLPSNNTDGTCGTSACAFATDGDQKTHAVSTGAGSVGGSSEDDEGASDGSETAQWARALQAARQQLLTLPDTTGERAEEERAGVKDRWRRRNEALRLELRDARGRLAELETLQASRERDNKQRGLRKLQSMALFVGATKPQTVQQQSTGADAEHHEPKTEKGSASDSGRETDDEAETVGKATATVLMNEDLRREVFIDDMLQLPKDLPRRDPTVLPYTVMRSHADRGANKLKERLGVSVGQDLVGLGSLVTSDLALTEPTMSAIGSPEELSRGPASPSSPMGSPVFLTKASEDILAKPVTSSAELVQICDEVFELIDSNNDGSLEFQEVQNFADTLPTCPSENKLRTLFRVADKNGSGRIEKSEFLAFLKLLEGTINTAAREMVSCFRSHCLGRLFDILDTDGAGMLSMNEVTALVRTLQSDLTQVYELRKLNLKINYSYEDIRVMFKAVDYDNSGDLDRDEFICFIKKVAGNVPVSHVTNAFLRQREVAADKLKLRKLWFTDTT